MTLSKKGALLPINPTPVIDYFVKHQWADCIWSLSSFLMTGYGRSLLISKLIIYQIHSCSSLMKVVYCFEERRDFAIYPNNWGPKAIQSVISMDTSYSSNLSWGGPHGPHHIRRTVLETKLTFLLITTQFLILALLNIIRIRSGRAVNGQLEIQKDK